MTHWRLSCENLRSVAIDGSATFTIATSSTTMKKAAHSRTSAFQRRGSGAAASYMGPPRVAGVFAEELSAPRRYSSAGELPWQVSSENAGDPERCVDERIEVDAGLDALALEQVDEVLGGDVPGRARSEGAAAEPADRGVQDGRAGLERGQGVRVAGVGGFVEVAAGRAEGGDAPGHAADCARRRDADRVGQNDLARAGLGQPPGDLDHRALVDGTVERVPEGDADRRGRRGAGSGPEDGGRLAQRLLPRHPGVALAERVRRRHGHVHAREGRGAEPLPAALVQN